MSELHDWNGKSWEKPLSPIQEVRRKKRAIKDKYNYEVLVLDVEIAREHLRELEDKLDRSPGYDDMITGEGFNG